MNSLDKNYQNLLSEILNDGTIKMDRTGTGTISVFGKQLIHDMSEGFPLLTTKKMFFKGVVTELLWFLRGNTNVKFLIDNNCNIWNGDLYKNYCKIFDNKVPFVKDEVDIKLTKEEFVNRLKNNQNFLNEFGDLGPVYGKQWRRWTSIEKLLKINEQGSVTEIYQEFEIDQIKKIFTQLEDNPDDRRMIVNSWNISDIQNMVLPPCHYSFQIYTQKIDLKKRINIWNKSSTIEEQVLEEFNKKSDEEKHIYLDEYTNVKSREISLLWNQRSVDTFLGLPFNLASYGLLLNILAQVFDMVPKKLIANLGDTHLYLNHIDQAKEQITRQPYELCNLKIKDNDWIGFTQKENNFDQFINSLKIEDFIIENYICHQTIKGELSN
jgi:thymidylate synthase